jgi:hypothetical protein
MASDNWMATSYIARFYHRHLVALYEDDMSPIYKIILILKDPGLVALPLVPGNATKRNKKSTSSFRNITRCTDLKRIRMARISRPHHGNSSHRHFSRVILGDQRFGLSQPGNTRGRCSILTKKKRKYCIHSI